MDFNIDEILEIAEQIERNGARYYRKAAAAIRGAPVALLEELADMEEEHRRTFAAMRAELSGGRPTTESLQPEAAAYLRALADGKIFDTDSDPTADWNAQTTPAQVLRRAVAMEKDSVIFYMTLQQTVSRPATSKRIERIIQEELSHVTILSDHLSALADGPVEA